MSAATLPLLRKKRDAFLSWLTANGAAVLTPTNEWEVVRYRDGGVTSIIYHRASGDLTFTGSARAAWDSFQSGLKWRAATPKAKRATGNKKRRAKFVETIRERDGDDCFYCGRHVDEDTESVEHLLSITHGGAPEHIANLFLAHHVCNQMAGHLSVVEKIATYHRARLELLGIKTTDPSPWED
jgi:hypothetical protein